MTLLLGMKLLLPRREQFLCSSSMISLAAAVYAQHRLSVVLQDWTVSSMRGMHGPNALYA